jgi:MGT family glycosyltransferase
LFNTDPAFYRNCFEAFGSEDCQVILSIGTNVSQKDLGLAPPNFIVECRVPQLSILERASAFVTHGGMNSVSESLCHGVPVVVVPQMGEQEVVGRRVEQLGAGLYLSKSDATPESLRASVRRLLAEERFRQQAAVVRESFQTAGGVQRAATVIQDFARRRTEPK